VVGRTGGIVVAVIVSLVAHLFGNLRLGARTQSKRAVSESAGRADDSARAAARSTEAVRSFPRARSVSGLFFVNSACQLGSGLVLNHIRPRTPSSPALLREHKIKLIADLEGLGFGLGRS
jgi:hypothetical protein